MMEAMRVAICEDNDVDLENALSAMRNSGYPIEVSSFSSGKDIVASFRRGLYHIVFLDIYLPDSSGIDIANSMRAKDGQVIIVFITSSGDHTRESYRLGALKYIEKPFAAGEVKAALDLAWRLRQNRECCTLITKQGKREVPLNDIVYVEVSNHTCVLHLENERVQTSLNIDHVALLLASPRFVRCHRSFIVNLEHVREIERDFLMTNGDRVYIRGKDEKKMAGLFARYLAAETRGLGDER